MLVSGLTHAWHPPTPGAIITRYVCGQLVRTTTVGTDDRREVTCFACLRVFAARLKRAAILAHVEGLAASSS